MAAPPADLDERRNDVARHAAGWSRPSRHRVLAILTGALLLALLLPATGKAHEAWLLTPEHMAEWNARPKPELFTRPTATNAAMLAAALAAIAGALLVAAHAGSRFSGIRAKLVAHERHTSLVLRLCLALTMAMAAVGLHPRHGTDLLEAATLGLPDLELRLLGTGWGWLAVVELAVAAALLLGLHVRAAATAVLLLTTLGLWLFDVAMLAYAGAMAGAAAYLALREGSPLRMGPPEQALFLVRVLTGAAFLWCGVYYKVLQPNLALAIVVEGGVPTFGFTPEAFVLGMALVETLAGILMIAGLLIRPIALALLSTFVFFSAVLGENPLGHMLFYGNLFALATGGAGSWRPAMEQLPAHARPAAAPI